MQKLKIILRTILCVVYGWLSGVCVPAFIAIAFNLTKGVGNNPDGIMFIPLGILLLLAKIFFLYTNNPFPSTSHNICYLHFY